MTEPPPAHCSVKASGKLAGSMHQMPSVSSSSGLPMSSTSSRASLMSSAPVLVTMPAISMLCQRAPRLIT